MGRSRGRSAITAGGEQFSYRRRGTDTVHGKMHGKIHTNWSSELVSKSLNVRGYLSTFFSTFGYKRVCWRDDQQQEKQHNKRWRPSPTVVVFVGVLNRSQMCHLNLM